MLRLCFDLPRYSVDFGFYLKKSRKDFLPFVGKTTEAYKKLGAEITDQQEKHYSFLWEIRMPSYPRRLKIEVRKDHGQSRSTQIGIAHSVHCSLQVRLRILTLAQMWENKIRALQDRKEIRDAYDLEFLCLRHAGDFESLDKSCLSALLKTLEAFAKNDYRVKLGSVLEREERERVISSRFSYLRSKIAAAL